jgi:hypothetical protein
MNKCVTLGDLYNHQPFLTGMTIFPAARNLLNKKNPLCFHKAGALVQ